MDTPFQLPKPKFDDCTTTSLNNFNKLRNPHFSTPLGMLLPRDKQPPPMYGPRGPTVPPKYFSKNSHHQQHRQQHNKANHHHNTQKKPVVQTNWNAWCETCDRDFKTSQELEKHQSEHQQCDVEGCKFVGHFLLVNKHKEMQHKSGIFEKIKKMESPAEIAKWRAERKKRYPTAANVELRHQAQEARLKRGERIDAPKNRFDRNNRRPGPNNNPNRTNQAVKRPNNRKRKINENKILEEKPIEKATEVDDESTSYKCFKGTSDMDDYHEKSTAKNALASLLSMYGSDDESDDSSDGTEASKIVGECAPPVENTPLVEEEPVAVSEVTIPQPTNDDQESKSKKRNRKRKNKTKDKSNPNVDAPGSSVPKPWLNYTKLRHSNQNTMLEKLLLPDIRHERNILLQCVRFVVDNNFFNIGAKEEENPALDKNV